MNLATLVQNARKKAILYTMTLILAFGGFALQAQTPVNPAVPKALYLLETEQIKKALAELDQAIAANPTDATLHYYKGYIYLRSNDKATAEDKANAAASFDKGIAVNEKEGINYAGKAYVSLLDKKADEGKALIEKALTLSRSKDIEVLKAVTEAYLVDNKYVTDAMATLAKTKKAGESDPDVNILYGDAYLLQNDGGRSVSSYERAGSLRATIAKPYYKVGLVFERSKNAESSLENFNKAISIDPKYTPAYRELGEIYYMLKQADKAVTAYETYLSLTENPDKYQYQYAFFLFMAKNYAKANEIFAKISNAADVRVVTLKFYAKSLTEAGDLEKAKELSDRFFAAAKKEEIDAKDYSDYGNLLLKLKQDSLGYIAYNKSLEINPNQQELLTLMAQTAFAAKKYELAIQSYTKLMEMHKDAPRSLETFNIGRAFYFTNRLDEADSAFSQFIRLQPEITTGYLWKANVATQRDLDSEKGLARPWFEKVLEKGAANAEKNKKDLISAHQYLAYYFFLHKDANQAIQHYKEWLILDPNSTDAKDALKILTAPPAPQKQPKN